MIRFTAEYSLYIIHAHAVETLMTGSSLKKVRRSLSKRGYAGTCRMVAGVIYRKVRDLTPWGRKEKQRREEAEREFDRMYDVDTAGRVSLAELRMGDHRWEDGVDYQPVWPSEFRQVLEEAGVDYPRYTFVDFGSGKGRAVLLACQYPFRKVVGVEFSRELVDVARRNLTTYSGPRRCPDVEFLCADAVRFPIPDGPAVLYLYNPFGPSVLGPVIDNIVRSLQCDPREAVVLYITPDHDSLWDRVESLTRVKTGNGYTIYKTSAAGAPAAPNPAR